MTREIKLDGGVTPPAAEGARATLLEVIERQIRDGAPKEVGGTLIRLSFLGYSRTESIRMIAVAFTSEMKDAMTTGRDFDTRSYVARLHLLPELSDQLLGKRG